MKADFRSPEVVDGMEQPRKQSLFERELLHRRDEAVHVDIFARLKNCPSFLQVYRSITIAAPGCAGFYDKWRTGPGCYQSFRQSIGWPNRHHPQHEHDQHHQIISLRGGPQEWV